MNWPVLIRTVEYGHSLPDRSIHWMVVTNGTLLTDDRAKELARLGIEVAVSVDGDRADHNRSRPTRGGNGSYDAVVSGVSALLRAKARLSLHSTHDGDGGSYQERFDHLTRLGQGRAAVVVAPETGSGQYRRGFGEQNRSWGSRLRSEWRAGRRTLPGYVSPMVSLILCGEHAQRQDCPAGSGLVDVTPSGEIFACHVSAARKQYRLGHLDDKLLAHVDPLGRAPMPKACTRCWANGLCSHGCPIRRSAGLEPSNDECETYREPIRCAAYFLSIASFDDVAQLWSLDANERRSLGRAWAVREMLRFQHRHIKPLSVFPALPTA